MNPRRGGQGRARLMSAPPSPPGVTPLQRERRITRFPRRPAKNRRRAPEGTRARSAGPQQRSLAWITNAIAGICEKPMPKWVVARVHHQLRRDGPDVLAGRLLISTGVGVWGLNQPARLGLGHHQLRLLDRHRSRRNADLRRSLFASCFGRNGVPRSTAPPRP